MNNKPETRNQIRDRKLKFYEELLTKLLSNRRDYKPFRIKAVITTLRFYRSF